MNSDISDVPENTIKPADEFLAEKACKGDKSAVEELIRRYQNWVYNLSLRMCGNYTEAEDLTQEIIMKFITNLSSFQGKSRFKTWLYRIAVNHNLNVKKHAWERYFTSFSQHTRLKEIMDKKGIESAVINEAEQKILTEELKTSCLGAMLLCLNRVQRLTIILGPVFNIDSCTAAKYLDLTPENFRQILARARKKISGFLNSECGLYNQKNHCRCEDKINTAVKMGIIKRQKNLKKETPKQKLGAFLSDNADIVDYALDLKLRDFFRQMPIYKSPSFSRFIKRILNNNKINNLIRFGEVSE